ncbi:HPr(Ser) kinase/phosphatase [Limosilactobacillus agrestis]|uniref:HPr kinase/phosphorylase n=1 Tax=Limosilactobacillus agrestis TaxID=2759748 RepID=A0A7W3YKI8_9LACO|nr:HPr(Ser) kinase/phosphatase [Limosilactobacillus agrestis]MBD5091303.1 HPr kinase/phosphorylase [Lactobacillus sp.]MBB1094983.1 HPr kinase/phosphorylase [Limosilactobacillus agrestis]MBB1099129.1 HPr kinase/phosphorylase [Limosilactobacillus agrestis]MCD7112463.1 HPr(Ser) kinase/phosphatase [Limosilactobacillus agrestis]MCD7119431.1 HPr(Ser) kinase/phosphatase [Limosilactobacillus agrestis]
MPNNVTVHELVDKVRLKVLQGGDYLQRKITTSDISRPALEFAGYFKHYPAARIQLLGITETSFAKDLTHEQREEYMTKMCMPQTPCFVISTNLPIPKELKKAAEDAKIPILGTHLTSSQILSNMTSYLLERLAPRKSLHGVLVDISGVGVLITGDSGVGKSETALELVRRGHRLIADDRVEVYARDEQTLVGTAPQILKHLMEIRGIGIIDVSTLYGTGAIMPSDQINLIVHLETWTPDVQFDRLGDRGDTQTIQGVIVPKVSVPVKTGRNLAIIIESAAMNYRAETMGYDATETFDRNLNQLIKQNSERDRKTNKGSAN